MLPLLAMPEFFQWMQQDNNAKGLQGVMGQWNHHLGTGFGVDETAHSHIVNSATRESTANIAKRSLQMATDACVSDHQRYLEAMGDNGVKVGPTNVSRHDNRQRTLDQFVVQTPNATTI